MRNEPCTRFSLSSVDILLYLSVRASCGTLLWKILSPIRFRFCLIPFSVSATCRNRNHPTDSTRCLKDVCTFHVRFKLHHSTTWSERFNFYNAAFDCNQTTHSLCIYAFFKFPNALQKTRNYFIIMLLLPLNCPESATQNVQTASSLHVSRTLIVRLYDIHKQAVCCPGRGNKRAG